MTSTAELIAEVVQTAREHGESSIIVLSGVAGTGKTHVSLRAAYDLAGHPAFVKTVQFHAAYGYEDFIEGIRPLRNGGFDVQPGIFLQWNEQALRDSDNLYVLLIEELSRAPINAVLGELMTYVEHRDRSFALPISRSVTSIAKNLVLLATMNPRDRSALEIDDALIRRLRILSCPPSVGQLGEMLRSSLSGNGTGPGEPDILTTLTNLFVECERLHPDTFEVDMPFGHGMFAGVRTVRDLEQLWEQRIRHLLRRPLFMPHPFADTISMLYPYRGYRQRLSASAPSTPTAPKEDEGSKTERE